MKPKEIYLLFLEEALELLPLIQAGLKELSENYNLSDISSNTVSSTITEVLGLLNALNSGISQARETQWTKKEISSDVFNLDELQTLIDNLYNLLSSFLEPTSKANLVELKQLWQTYTKLKYCLLTHLSQAPSGKLGILAKGEFLFYLAQLHDNLAASTGIDSDLQKAMVHKDMVQSLASLQLILDSSNIFEQSTELKNQADIFSGLGELLELKDLIAIAESVSICIEDNKDNLQTTQLIAQRALACWQAVQTALSSGNANYKAEDWRKFLFLIKDNQALISTTFSSEIKLEQIPQFSSPRILQTEQFFMWLWGYNIFFLPANLVLEMVIPQTKQIKFLDNQQIFIWQDQNIPIYLLSDLLNYNYLLPDNLNTNNSKLILVVKHNSNLTALEISVEQPVVESSLTLKSFDPILTTPSYVCGCTLLANDLFKAVIDVKVLLDKRFN